MIDTTTIKVGDKVRLRNGQVHTVMYIKIDGHIDYPVDIIFVGKEKYRTSYAPSGKYWVGRKDPWDIVEINPAIDTTTIKVGDKIRLRNGDTHTVTEVYLTSWTSCGMFPVHVHWLGDGSSYTTDGFYRSGQNEDPRDIVEIIPAEASTSSRDGLGSHSHSFILEKPKKQYVWKATVQYHGSKDGGWSKEINEVHYFTDPTCMESLSKLAFDNYGSITVERYELLQQKD